MVCWENGAKVQFCGGKGTVSVQGGQTNFGLCFGGGLTDVSEDHTQRSLLTVLPLFIIQVCASLNTFILSRILAGMREMAKVDFQIFQSGSVGFCGSTTWNYAARKLGNL